MQQDLPHHVQTGGASEGRAAPQQQLEAVAVVVLVRRDDSGQPPAGQGHQWLDAVETLHAGCARSPWIATDMRRCSACSHLQRDGVFHCGPVCTQADWNATPFPARYMWYGGVPECPAVSTRQLPCCLPTADTRSTRAAAVLQQGSCGWNGSAWLVAATHWWMGHTAVRGAGGVAGLVVYSACVHALLCALCAGWLEGGRYLTGTLAGRALAGGDFMHT
jgi:hypothetical protein